MNCYDKFDLIWDAYENDSNLKNPIFDAIRYAHLSLHHKLLTWKQIKEMAHNKPEQIQELMSFVDITTDFSRATVGEHDIVLGEINLKGLVRCRGDLLSRAFKEGYYAYIQDDNGQELMGNGEARYLNFSVPSDIINTSYFVFFEVDPSTGTIVHITHDSSVLKHIFFCLGHIAASTHPIRQAIVDKIDNYPSLDAQRLFTKIINCTFEDNDKDDKHSECVSRLVRFLDSKERGVSAKMSAVCDQCPYSVELCVQ